MVASTAAVDERTDVKQSIIITKENIQELRDIVFERFNEKPVWVDGSCIGFPTVSTVKEKGIVYEENFSIKTRHTDEQFSVGDRVELYDQYLLLYLENEFIREVLPAGVESVPRRIETKEYDADSHQKHLADEFFYKIEGNFSHQVGFGKSMIGTYGEQDKDEDWCHSLIFYIHEMLRNEPYPIPDVLEKEIVVSGVSLKIKINWKRFVDAGEAWVSGVCNDKEFENLVYLYLKCLPFTEENVYSTVDEEKEV